MKATANHANTYHGGFTWVEAPEKTYRLRNITFAAPREGAWPETRNCHTSWTLDYFHNEGALIRVGLPSAPWMARGGFMAHLYPPNLPYWEDTKTMRQPLVSSWVDFDAGDDTALTRLVDNTSGFARFHDPERLLLPALNQLSIMARTFGNDGYWEAMPAFLNVMSLLRRAVPVNTGIFQIVPTSEAATSHPLVAHVQAYLRLRLTQNIDVSAVAAHVHMSVSGLIRRYRRETGETPMHHYTVMRIRLSKAMLLEGRSVKATADSLGFADAFHFSRVFRKHEGVPPTAYVSGLRSTK